MFTDDDLRDPAPPVPGATERAAVTTRANQIKRHRRLAAAGGAIGLVGVLSFGVVAISGGGGSNPANTRVEVAGTSVTHDVDPATTLAPSPAPSTLAPAPAETSSPDVTSEPAATDAPVVTAAPAPAVVPATFTVSGIVSGVPAGVTATVRLQGDGGTFTTTTAPDGSFSISGVPAGHYTADYSWQSADGAAQVGRVLNGIDVAGDTTISFN